jgi:hypothetical protein
MTIIDNHTNDWKTITSSDTVTTPQENQSPIQAQAQHQTHSQVHTSRRPTDRLEEFFYEQAKFFRHLERKYERFNQKSREDEQYARAGKFRHRPKASPEQIQQRQQQQQQQQGKPVVYGPYTLKQQQALDQRRAQRQASNPQQGQASGSNQKESVRNSKGEVLKGK